MIATFFMMIASALCLALFLPLGILAYYGRVSALVIPITALFSAIIFAGVGAGFGWLVDAWLSSTPSGLVIGTVAGGFLGSIIGAASALAKNRRYSS